MEWPKPYEVVVAYTRDEIQGSTEMQNSELYQHTKDTQLEYTDLWSLPGFCAT